MINKENPIWMDDFLPNNGWFMMVYNGKFKKMDDLGYPYFRKPPNGFRMVESSSSFFGSMFAWMVEVVNQFVLTNFEVKRCDDKLDLMQDTVL